MTEVYKLSVALAMSSNHAQVLGSLMQGLGLAHGHVLKLTQGFDRLKLAIGGAFSAFAGDKILRGVVDIAKASENLSTELVKIKNMGVDDTTLSAVRAQAVKVAQAVRGTTE